MKIVDEKSLEFLMHGFDTVQCAYFLEPAGKERIDFDWLTRERENIKQRKDKEPKHISLGAWDFLLHPFGSSSGYPIVISNEDFRIEMGEFNFPSFFVTFRSQGLWKESAFLLHQKFLKWAEYMGYAFKEKESLSRVDFCFDYHLPEIDFNEDYFVSRSSKDSQYRDNGRIETFRIGKGDIILRVYDKVSEIKQKSEKVWFYLLWGRDCDVWRIEWQIRKPVLRQFGIRTFENLKERQGDLLRYLAGEHDTLRIPNEDKNRSRWVLHPLWIDLQERVRQIESLGVSRVIGQPGVLQERMVRIGISVYGYLKRVAAIRCTQRREELIKFDEAMEALKDQMLIIHDPLNWRIDVQKRIDAIRCGEW